MNVFAGMRVCVFLRVCMHWLMHACFSVHVRTCIGEWATGCECVCVRAQLCIRIRACVCDCVSLGWVTVCLSVYSLSGSYDLFFHAPLHHLRCPFSLSPAYHFHFLFFSPKFSFFSCGIPYLFFYYSFLPYLKLPPYAPHS